MSTDSGNRKYQALALGTSYALGTFNDNFFKQAGLLLAVTTGNAVFQSQVTFLFALPFVLFSAWSGWLADRFAKKSLVICAKTLELAAMLAGAWGMVTLDWNWMLAMTFCMGLSSTLFSPALNGSIPDCFPSAKSPASTPCSSSGPRRPSCSGCSSPGSRWIRHGSKRLTPSAAGWWRYWP